MTASINLEHTTPGDETLGQTVPPGRAFPRRPSRRVPMIDVGRH